jgi:hypothetical protein
MDRSYIVRIYRRAPSRVGIVEDPHSGRRIAFHSAAELWAIVMPGGGKQAVKAKAKGKARSAVARRR